MTRIAMCLILLAPLLLGCVDEKTIDQWNRDCVSMMGHSFDYLVSTMGRPTSVRSDGSGGRVVIFDYSSERVVMRSQVATTEIVGLFDGKPLNAVAATTYQQPAIQRNIAIAAFHVNPDGIVDRWGWQCQNEHRSGTTLPSETVEREADTVRRSAEDAALSNLDPITRAQRARF